MKISVVPLYKTDLKNTFFDYNQLYNVPYYIKHTLEQAGHEVATVDIIDIATADFIILFDLNIRYLWDILINHKASRTIYIPLEPPAVYAWHEPAFLKSLIQLLPCILSWQDDLIDNKNFFKIYFFYYYSTVEIPLTPFSEKKLLTMVIGNKTSSHPDELYTKRLKLIEFCERNIPQEFDFYGTNWPEDKFATYKGTISDKCKIMGGYKFSICFENQCNIKGYITEKILDCFRAKTVPIYFGASNITDYIPAEAFIDYRNFSSNDALLAHLKNMDKQQYNLYLAAANAFLQSTKFEKFLPLDFALQVKQAFDRLMTVTPKDYSIWKGMKTLISIYNQKSKVAFLKNPFLYLRVKRYQLLCAFKYW